MITKNRQGGASLVVGLIMLVVLTLLVVSSIRASNSNLRIAGNMQAQEEGVIAAQQAVERMLSSNFTTIPAAAPISVDVNGDGTADYTGQVDIPVCTSSITLTNNELDPFSAADSPCISSGQSTNSGIVGASGVVASTPSWCYKQSWEITSTAISSRTESRAVVHQGVFIRVPTGTACP